MKNNSVTLTRATIQDAVEILALQKLAFTSVAEMYDDYSIPPLTQTLPEMRGDFENYTILKAVYDGKIIGSVRGQLTGDSVYIGRLMVLPNFENNGLGTKLMNAIEAEFPWAKKFVLSTGHKSERNLYLYHKLGYKDTGCQPVNNYFMVLMEKTKNN